VETKARLDYSDTRRTVITVITFITLSCETIRCSCV